MRGRGRRQIDRNSSDGSHGPRPPLVSTTEYSNLAGEPDIFRLGNGNLAVLVRPGTAAGLGVHSLHQVLYLVNIDSRREAKRRQVQSQGRGEEEEKPGQCFDDHGWGGEG